MSADIDCDVAVASDVAIEVDARADVSCDVFFEIGDSEDGNPDEDEYIFNPEVFAGLAKRDAANPFCGVPESLLQVYADKDGIIRVNVVGEVWGRITERKCIGNKKVVILKMLAQEIEEWCKTSRTQTVETFLREFPRFNFDDMRENLQITDSTFRDVITKSAIEFCGVLIPVLEIFQ